MKKMMFLLALAFLFFNNIVLLGKDTDTIFVSVDELLKTKRGGIEIEVKQGQVISFKANKELLIHSRMFFKFWKEKNQRGLYDLHSKGKIIFGRKSPNENIPVVSPVTGIVVIKLRRYGLTATVIGVGIFVVLVKIMRPF